MWLTGAKDVNVHVANEPQAFWWLGEWGPHLVDMCPDKRVGADTFFLPQERTNAPRSRMVPVRFNAGPEGHPSLLATLRAPP